MVSAMLDADGVFHGTVQEARKVKAKFYFTGKTCARNHLSKRYVVSMGCHQCQEESRQRVAAELAAARGEESRAPEGPMPFLHILSDWSPFVIIPPGCQWVMAE
jgi:hypothetical protein